MAFIQWAYRFYSWTYLLFGVYLSLLWEIYFLFNISDFLYIPIWRFVFTIALYLSICYCETNTFDQFSLIIYFIHSSTESFHCYFVINCWMSFEDSSSITIWIFHIIWKHYYKIMNVLVLVILMFPLFWIPSYKTRQNPLLTFSQKHKRLQ